MFGLLATPSALAVGVHLPLIGEAALSLAITVFVLRLLRAPHPPAGATTLIVSLGFLTTLVDLGLMMTAIVLVMISAWTLNRLLGVPAPIWYASTPDN